jgi:NADH-quinone oxidoreductase subunit G
VAGIEQLGAALIVGSNLREEVPLLAHRLRKAALRGAAVSFINPGRYEYLFPITEYVEADAASLVTELGKILKAAADKTMSPAVTSLLKRAGNSGEHHRRLVTTLQERKPSAVLLGLISLRHPAFGELHVLAAELARLTGATLGFITEGPNSAGLALAGVLPHREAGGKPRSRAGRTAADMLGKPPRGLVLFGAEPDGDFSQDATEALRSSGFLIALSPWFAESLKEVAHVVLPIAAFAETSGTFVNAEGRWQGFDAVARPPGEARPGWKVLRVLANRMGVPDCDFASSEAIRDRLQAQIGDLAPASGPDGPTLAAAASPPQASTLDVPMYRVDALVRRAPALQLASATAQPRTASPLRRAS